MLGVFGQPAGVGQADAVPCGFQVQEQPRPLEGMPWRLPVGTELVPGAVMVVVG